MATSVPHMRRCPARIEERNQKKKSQRNIDDGDCSGGGCFEGRTFQSLA
jgi:hypothetical protein